MDGLYERGVRQKAYRQRQKEKHQAMERRLQELSEKVISLEQERDQLLRAVDSATGDSEGTLPGRHSGPGQLDDDKVVASFCFGECTTQLYLTEQGIMALTPDAMADIWKRLVQQMALCLDKLDAAQVDSPLWPRLEDTVHEAVRYQWTLVRYNPRMVSAFTKCNMEAPNAHAPQSSSGDSRDWPTILARVHLSERQAEQLIACRRSMLREMGALFAEWDCLWTALQVLRPLEEQQEGLANVCAQHVGIIERLRVIVHALFHCRAFYISYACTKVLSPVDTARYLLACYPMAPDTHSLMTCLARQRGEPSTSELLHKARPMMAIAAQAGPGAPEFASTDWCQALKLPLRLLLGNLHLPAGVQQGLS